MATPTTHKNPDFFLDVEQLFQYDDYNGPSK